MTRRKRYAYKAAMLDQLAAQADGIIALRAAYEQAFREYWQREANPTLWQGFVRWWRA